MKTLKHTLCLIVAFILMESLAVATNKTIAVNTLTPQELHVGDKVPDVMLMNLLNASSQQGRLTDVTKGRYLIIDFFATWCGPCVGELPVLDKLQRQFKSDLQILAVSNEKTAVVAKFLKTNESVKDNSLPFETEDRLLMQYFPHIVVPHEVWINNKGIVTAITSHDDVTETNIRRFVAGQTVTLDQKSDMMDYNEDLPLFKNGNAGDGNSYLARSILTDFIPGLAGFNKMVLDDQRNLKRIIFPNIDVIMMFYNAYSRLQYGGFNTKRVIVSPEDSAYIYKPLHITNGAEFSKYQYCYEYIPTHAVSQDVAFADVMIDLNRYFDIGGTIEKRVVPCWVLKLKDKKLLDASHGEDTTFTVQGVYHNKPFKWLTIDLNQYHNMEPVVDETKISGNVYMDVALDGNLNNYPDIPKLQESLNKYGVEMVKEDRPVDILVLRRKH